MATSVGYVGKRDDLESINHRLALLDSMAHRVGLIEELNARLIALEDRLLRNPVDQVSMEVVAAKLRDVASTTADRLEALERRLIEVSEQIARSS